MNATKNVSVQKGLNTDLEIRGKLAHVQTEDWGAVNPFIVTRIFIDGAVKKTIKTPYETALKNGPVKHGEAVQQALRQQHQKAIDDLWSGF